MFWQAGCVNDQVDLRAVFSALPETNGIVDEIDARAALGDLVGANQLVEMNPHLRCCVRHRQANNGRVLFQAPPVTLIGKGFAAGNAHRGENTPAANEARLPGRKPNFPDGQKTLVVKNIGMNHLRPPDRDGNSIVTELAMKTRVPRNSGTGLGMAETISYRGRRRGARGGGLRRG